MFNESLFTAIAAITKYFIFSLFAFSAVSTELIFFFFFGLSNTTKGVWTKSKCCIIWATET